MFRQDLDSYIHRDCRDFSNRDLTYLREELKLVKKSEIISSIEGKRYIELLKKFREAVAENDKLKGENYPELLCSILSNELYSNNLRFIFELIQNVDDCDYLNSENCNLDIHFDFENNVITLKYNEVGFTPFNVFSITGIAEAAKNISSNKDEIGEKGIGFKSVFGIANRVWIRSGWFSFELYKDNFTIPIPRYESDEYYDGTCMVLYVPNKVKEIYNQIKNRYCKKNAVFSNNPILFLNKLTRLRLYYDSWRSMEFKVSSHPSKEFLGTKIENNIAISVDLSDHDSEKGDVKENKQILCTRYSIKAPYSKDACKSRYGNNTKVGADGDKEMLLQVLVPDPEYVNELDYGALYSFLPTQLKLSVPIVCHVPFKLQDSREFVDPQENNLWFQETTDYLQQILDYVYLDLCKTVKQNIVLYLPDKEKSIFLQNNGKEECLSNNNDFLGEHYLKLPLFCATDNLFYSIDEICCFSQEEQIIEPQNLYKLLSLHKHLFIMPNHKNYKYFGIKIIENAYNKLLVRAFTNSDVTADALSLLKRANYRFSENVESVLNENTQLSFTKEQIEIFSKYEEIWDALTHYSCKKIRENSRPKFVFDAVEEKGLSYILYDEFSVEDTPKAVEKYLKYCNEGYICANIGKDMYLPCFNGVILSKTNPMSSFTTFCFALDKNSTFSIRMKLRQVSDNLDEITDKDEIGTEYEYIRNLRDIRKIVKDSLGKEGYEKYIELILRSGTDKNRFIQELIQNADDCEYDPKDKPKFSLSQRGNTIVTKYNETGFTRKNIRSITAIGESTKNSLIYKGDTIGEKGVGFKTIFSIAKEVKISSGNYHFALTDSEPTIPRVLENKNDFVDGTRMEISLKGNNTLSIIDNKELLKLCLCLRHLKELDIGGHIVKIEDTGNIRMISIDNKSYKFKKFTHTFTLPSNVIFEQNKTEHREVNPIQKIVCYVSERKADTGFIYNGLPTRHKLNIPMSIDAPFELTTSREYIEVDKNVWNDCIRKEFYRAIINVMINLRDTERIEVLRFIHFLPRRFGQEQRYINDITDSDYIKEFEPMNLLVQGEYVPTYNSSIFVSPSSNSIRRYPKVAQYLFDKGEFGTINPCDIVDEQNSEYSSAFIALSINTANFDEVFSLIEAYSEKYIENSDYAQLLFDYLQEASDEYIERIAALKIIPVYGMKNGQTQYLSYDEMQEKLYVKKNAFVSNLYYYILNERILSKAKCERILGVNINEMNSEFEKAQYQYKLRNDIRNTDDDIEEIYRHILREHKNGNLKLFSAYDFLKENIELVPLKNQLGEITDNRLFICNQSVGYFDVDMIKSISVSEECKDLAKRINCPELESIHYDDINWNELLTADDIECIKDDYFLYSDELLRKFYYDDLIPSELWQKYNLDYLIMGENDNFDECEFPEKAVSDFSRLKQSVKRQVENPTKIIPIKKTVTAHVGQKPNGETFELQVADAREGVMSIYRSESAKDIYFCQKCRKAKKSKQFIEVRNLLPKPEYFFTQLRISLCLECSQYYRAYRDNDAKINDFIERLLQTDADGEGTVEVPLDAENSLTFTATHLAEIQEILKSDLFK